VVVYIRTAIMQSLGAPLPINGVHAPIGIAHHPWFEF
jgi:hypothetical protein